MDNVTVFEDQNSLLQGAANQIVEMAQAAIEVRGFFFWVLSGGSTPAPLYEILAKPPYADKIDWRRVHLFFGDERAVPPNHTDSNFGMVVRTLLQHIQIPKRNVHRIAGEKKPDVAAAQYAHELRALYKDAPPLLDLVLLGMGNDGHTASLFPGTDAVYENEQWVVAHYVESQNAHRITLTPGLLNQAQNVAFLVSGAGKAEMLKTVLQGAYNPARYPAQVIRPANGQLLWWVDADAARLLNP